ncbi:hypothetical protein SORBI_3009G026101 [Sorghum bicolor]|uniref:Glycosyltransferases n=1 Tax=Sorghum bicolor TaxID=4558 RepID=A0A1Z5R0J3_SORBI|nr:hypothetical protein SORBI_3009G026101 [Sorghum bicolor]
MEKVLVLSRPLTAPSNPSDIHHTKLPTYLVQFPYTGAHSTPVIYICWRPAFGTWPVATMLAGEKKVVVEGPLCSASKVVGWFSRDFNDGTTRSVTYNTEVDLNPAGAAGTRAHTIDVSGFAFNSSILWDPERWGRPTSLPDTSQDSIKFVQEVVLEDRAKLKGIPSDCSQIMVWQYSVPSSQ